MDVQERDGSGGGGAVIADRRRLADEYTIRAFDGARLAAWVHGDPAAPVTVVLVHGWTLTASGWRPHVERLLSSQPDGAAPRVVTFDLRAHGASERGTAPITGGTLAADLAEVLTACAPVGPVVLSGHSLGGMMILALADEWPELFAGNGGPIAGSVLISTSAGGGGAVAQWQAAVEHTLLAALIAHPRVAELVRRFLTGPGAHQRTLPLWRLAVGNGPDAQLARRSAEDFRDVPLRDIVEFYRAVDSHDRRGRLAALADLPTTVLVGASDRFLPPAEAVGLAAELPRAKLRVVPGYGHDLPYDRPDVIADAITEVITRQAR